MANDAQLADSTSRWESISTFGSFPASVAHHGLSGWSQAPKDGRWAGHDRQQLRFSENQPHTRTLPPAVRALAAPLHPRWPRSEACRSRERPSQQLSRLADRVWVPMHRSTPPDTAGSTIPVGGGPGGQRAALSIRPGGGVRPVRAAWCGSHLHGRHRLHTISEPCR